MERNLPTTRAQTTGYHHTFHGSLVTKVPLAKSICKTFAAVQRPETQAKGTVDTACFPGILDRPIAYVAVHSFLQHFGSCNGKDRTCKPFCWVTCNLKYLATGHETAFCVKNCCPRSLKSTWQLNNRLRCRHDLAEKPMSRLAERCVQVRLDSEATCPLVETVKFSQNFRIWR